MTHESEISTYENSQNNNVLLARVPGDPPPNGGDSPGDPPPNGDDKPGEPPPNGDDKPGDPPSNGAD